MSAARCKYAWIVLCLASIFIYLKTDAVPLNSQPSELQQTSHQYPLIDTFLDFDDTLDTLQSPPESRKLLKRSPDSDDDGNDNESDDNKPSSTTTEKSDSNFHHGDHGHGHGHTVLKPTHSSNGHGHHNEDDDDNRNNNSGSGGFNILEFFGTIFRLVWGFVSNIPALLFGTSSSSSSGGQ